MRPAFSSTRQMAAFVLLMLGFANTIPQMKQILLILK